MAFLKSPQEILSIGGKRFKFLSMIRDPVPPKIRTLVFSDCCNIEISFKTLFCADPPFLSPRTPDPTDTPNSFPL